MWGLDGAVSVGRGGASGGLLGEAVGGALDAGGAVVVARV